MAFSGWKVFAPDFDVVVVGAGVAGSKAAFEASREGARVLLVEDHRQVGVPSHCSGVVSLAGLKLLGLENSPKFGQRLVRGARLHSPNGEVVEVARKEPVAVVLNRMKLDQFLAKEAIAGGAELRTRTRATSFERHPNGEALIALQDSEKVTCKAVVDASGRGSRLPKLAGIETPDWSQLLPGLQYELVKTDGQDDMVDLFFGSKVAPGFFAWSIPTGDDSARVGLASAKGNVKNQLDGLVKERWPESEVDATKSGSVLVSGPISKCWSPNFLVAGDAAGQVKQTTGGGIVIGGYCGMLAGASAAKFAASGIEGIHFLKKYDADWRAMFASDLRRMSVARKIFSGLSDETLDRLFRALAPRVTEVAQFADMDFQGRIISRFLRDRKFVSILPRVLADSLRAVFA